jgi:hypothetical protein
MFTLSNNYLNNEMEDSVTMLLDMENESANITDRMGRKLGLKQICIVCYNILIQISAISVIQQ